ncbi:MAG: hypothetical protein KKG49_14810, partial [Gammaproteobacteria bacterium]|nr:hypothetical protein [Gammaproteobacteria bacterium]
PAGGLSRTPAQQPATFHPRSLNPRVLHFRLESAQVAALASTYSFLRGERLPKLVDFSLDYLSSAGPMDLYAVCDMHRVGKRIAAVGVRCWQQSPDNPVGVGRAHVFIAQSASDPNLQHVRSDQNSIAAHLATATGANSPLPTKAEDSK